MKGPSHNLKEFVKDCSENKDKVVVWPVAANTALKDFRVKNVVQFIGDGELKNPSFINTKRLELNPDPTILIMTDAYGFYSGCIFGYLAFFYHPKIERWQIKSFKRNEQPDPRNLPFMKLKEMLTQH